MYVGHAFYERWFLQKTGGTGHRTRAALCCLGSIGQEDQKTEAPDASAQGQLNGRNKTYQPVHLYSSLIQFTHTVHSYSASSHWHKFQL